MPTVEEMTKRIARCIGIWETNRGGDDPAPKESALDTVAGLHASMATIEQATMPYAVTALKTYQALRDAAIPPLTVNELAAADGRCGAVVKLLRAIVDASAASITPGDFIGGNVAAITATGLGNDDVGTMFKAVVLKRTIDALNADVTAGTRTLDAAVAAVSIADRLGLGPASLRAYVRKPVNWGENRAAWQRKAVNAMAAGIGSRIQAVAVSDGGTALAGPVIRARVSALLASNPGASVETIVRTVAQQNNSGEADYGKHVWENYARLYPA